MADGPVCDLSHGADGRRVPLRGSRASGGRGERLPLVLLAVAPVEEGLELGAVLEEAELQDGRQRALIDAGLEVVVERSGSPLVLSRRGGSWRR